MYNGSNFSWLSFVLLTFHTDHFGGCKSSFSLFFLDMLDSPVSGNSASTRSSSDSYSSSSSTKQLLSSTTAANIIVDDKTAMQNAVNV